MNEKLLEGIRFFTGEEGILSGLSVICGNGEHTESAMDGEDIRASSVFDLASGTKLFTGLVAMRLKEAGVLDFSRRVTFYDPRFDMLGDTTVEELMSFAVTIRTPLRLDACPDRESAVRALFAASVTEKAEKRPYSDIPAMILKYVIESATGESLYGCVRELILQPAGMRETWARVPEARREDCQLYDGEHRIEAGRRIVRTGLPRGIPHDPKAAVLQGDTGDLCGHAGLFSTLEDMARFCRAVLAGRIVGEASLREMAINRTGHRLPDGGWSQFLGYQCYLRHPDQYYSEIPAYMGMRAFGIGGFTGNHVSMDPERNLFTVFLGNRVKNRLTVLVPEEGKTLADYGLKPDGRGMIRWEDGEIIHSSVQYVHHKDAHLHRAVMQALSLPEIPFRLCEDR